MRYIIGLIIILLASLIIWMSSLSIEKINVHTNDIICIEPLKDYTYKTCKPITYTIEDSDLTIPESYETDLASIPRLFWNISSPARSEFMSAAILHDFLYSCHDSLTRKEVDDVFYNLLVDNGVGKTEALVFYMAVRLFGGSHFNGECAWIQRQSMV